MDCGGRGFVVGGGERCKFSERRRMALPRAAAVAAVASVGSRRERAGIESKGEAPVVSERCADVES